MKALALLVTTMMFAIQLSALTTLTISPLGNGYYQIVAPGSSGSPIFPPLSFALQSSPDLITWTSISTNSFPYTGAGDGVTNIVHATAPMMFYRTISLDPIVIGP
jgi:hypothetical protein